MFKNKAVLIYDLGLGIEYAVRLAKDFGKVFYFVPWANAFPKSNLALIGSGFDNIERVLYFWEYVDTVDLICFFDTYNADIVEYLRKKGKRVFGAGYAEELEKNRWDSRKLQQSIGLPTQETVRVTGVDNLIEYLKKNDNKFVKINSFRGDIETFHHEKYNETEAQYLGEILLETGAKGKTLEFIIEEKLEGVEPGYDGWVVDGQYPPICMWGYEKKGAGYIGKVDYDKDLPDPIKMINKKLGPTFKRLTARTMYSSELLVTNGKGYMIDPCVRAPMPVGSAIHVEIWENFSEIIWNAAEGKIVKPIPLARYGAGTAFDSPWADKHWTLIEFPKEMRQWVKLRMAFCSNDHKYYALPGFSSLGSVIGLGNTIKEAVGKVEERIDKIKANEISITMDGLNDIMDKVIPDGEKAGLKF